MNGLAERKGSGSSSMLHIRSLVMALIAGLACTLVVAPCLGAQEPTGVVLYVQAGTLDTLSDSSVVLKLPLGSTIHTMVFLINKTAIMDKLRKGERANAVYTKKDSRNILISLQRLPSLKFGVPPSGDEHSGVAEVVVPKEETSALLNAVGTVDPSTQERGMSANVLKNVVLSGKSREQGWISGIRWLDATGYTITLKPSPNAQVLGAPTEDIFVDLLTRIEGDLQKNSAVQIRYKEENGAKVATLVKVVSASMAAPPRP
jgi:hypothetical protein